VSKLVKQVNFLAKKETTHYFSPKPMHWQFVDLIKLDNKDTTGGKGTTKNTNQQ